MKIVGRYVNYEKIISNKNSKTSTSIIYELSLCTTKNNRNTFIPEESLHKTDIGIAHVWE